MDNRILSIGTIFEARMNDDLVTVDNEIAHGRIIRCGQNNYVRFGKRLAAHGWLVPDLANAIAEQLQNEPTLRKGTVLRRYWGNGKVFTWKIVEDELGLTLHLDCRGEARRGMFYRISWWWLAHTA